MGIGNLYDDGNVLGETREVQLAADLIHPRGGKGGGGARCGRRQRKGHSLLNLREYRREIFFFPPCCLSVIIIILITTLHTS